MVKKLRKRVILYTLIAVALVLFILMGIVNAANYVSKDRAATQLLEFLAENGGAFPGRPDDEPPPAQDLPERPEENGAPEPFRPGMTAETPYETRFFLVSVSADGTIDAVDTGRIAAVDSEAAVAMAEKAEAAGRTSGYDGNYKYLMKENDGEKLYLFLDCTRDLDSVRSFLKTSLLVSLLGLAGIALLVVLLSPRMVRPIAESYARQKEFITNAGHELKTPLSVIESCAEVVEMESGQTKWTAGIKEQVQKLSDLTAQMVSLARMDEGKDLPMEEVDLTELTARALDGFCLEAEQQGRVIEKSLEDNIRIRGNAPLLAELISILADNALKYAVREQPIRFSLSRQGKKVVLTAENHAEGFAKGSQEKLFDRFYRGDVSHSSAQPGSGIGLSMARSIAEAHGGEIEAASPDGERLVITVTLL